jgi:hypothetical protein
MRKIRSTAIGLILGVICGTFIWVATWPRPWDNPRPTRATLPVHAHLLPAQRPADSAAPFPAPLVSRAPELLPLVAREISLEGPRETFSTALLTTVEITPPAAPDLTDDALLDVAEDGAVIEDQAPGAWPVPERLLAQLAELAETDGCASWALEVKERLGRLATANRVDARGSAAALEELKRLADQAAPLAAGISSPAQRTSVRAAGYALARRVEVWRSAHQLAQRPLVEHTPVSLRTEEMLQRLAEVDGVLGSGPHANDWRRYLLLPRTRLVAEAGEAADDPLRRDHASRVLRRLEWSGLTRPQRDFLAGEPFQSLAAELRAWASEPFDVPFILTSVEAYEEQPSLMLARRIAQDRLRLRWTGDPQAGEMADRLEAHYRNANVRAAVSQELLSLLAPEPQTNVHGVRDTIGGAAVRGQSETTARVDFRVIPDDRRLRLLLEADGDVATDTRSSKSGAVFLSRGQGTFRARKEIVFDGQQVIMAPAVAEADLRDGLRSVATDYDGVPLLNLLAQSIARQGHAETRFAARREAEEKMAWRVASRLDDEAEQRLAEWESRVEDRIGKPLDRMALLAMPIDLQTSSSRLIARYRLAGDLQLGAHTPRPQAPSDSLLSVQVHESAVNNALARLPLAGRETDLPGLLRDVLESVGFGGQPLPDDLPEDVELRLAGDEPVRVDLLDGQARVTIRLDYLKTDDRTWRNITSRAYYAPQSDGLSARMARTGIVELSGDHLRMRDQLALRAIFCKVFTERRMLHLVPERVAQAEKLASLEVTQLVIRDGWIGLALGPRRIDTPGVAMK